MVEKHYSAILRVFDFYCSIGSASPYQMSLNAFSSFCEESHITDNESPFCRKSDLDTLFIIGASVQPPLSGPKHRFGTHHLPLTSVCLVNHSAKSFSTEKGSKLDKLKDDNCLMRFEFVEALVRIAVVKIGKIEHVRLTLT
jgi:hypothetical protein